MSNETEATETNVAAIARILAGGATADIFYHARDHDDEPAEYAIDEVQSAMTDAAAALPMAVSAMRAIWEFASIMVERHGANGDDTMTDEDHSLWQESAGQIASLLNVLERPVTVGEIFDSAELPSAPAI